LQLDISQQLRDQEIRARFFLEKVIDSWGLPKQARVQGNISVPERIFQGKKIEVKNLGN